MMSLYAVIFLIFVTITCSGDAHVAPGRGVLRRGALPQIATGRGERPSKLLHSQQQRKMNFNKLLCLIRK